jgi:hypothetical protein
MMPIPFNVQIMTRFKALTLASGLYGMGLEERSETGTFMAAPQLAQKMRSLPAEAPQWGQATLGVLIIYGI